MKNTLNTANAINVFEIVRGRYGSKLRSFTPVTKGFFGKGKYLAAYIKVFGNAHEHQRIFHCVSVVDSFGNEVKVLYRDDNIDAAKEEYHKWAPRPWGDFILFACNAQEVREITKTRTVTASHEISGLHFPLKITVADLLAKTKAFRQDIRFKFSISVIDGRCRLL